MNIRALVKQHRVICYSLVGLLIGSGIDGLIVPPEAQAQSFLEKLGQIISPPPGQGSAAGRSRGGAIRGNCAAINRDAGVETNLVALIPQGNLGKTVEANPTFWFYVPTFGLLPTKAASPKVTSPQPVGSPQPTGSPQSATPAKPAAVSASKLTPVKMGEFVLLDDAGKSVLKQPIAVNLPQQSGFVRFTLPTDPSFWMPGKSLQSGKKYNWFFSIVCDSRQPDKNPTVRGWVERVEAPSDLLEKLKKSPSADRYIVYVENGIWYEGLTLLAENRQKARANWVEVLNRLGLAKTTDAPITTIEPIKP
jgi:Domain of Unknown Function (DUF928)